MAAKSNPPALNLPVNLTQISPGTHLEQGRLWLSLQSLGYVMCEMPDMLSATFSVYCTVVVEGVPCLDCVSV